MINNTKMLKSMIEFTDVCNIFVILLNTLEIIGVANVLAPNSKLISSRFFNICLNVVDSCVPDIFYSA